MFAGCLPFHLITAKDEAFFGVPRYPGWSVWQRVWQRRPTEIVGLFRVLYPQVTDGSKTVCTLKNGTCPTKTITPVYFSSLQYPQFVMRSIRYMVSARPNWMSKKIASAPFFAEFNFYAGLSSVFLLSFLLLSSSSSRLLLWHVVAVSTRGLVVVVAFTLLKESRYWTLIESIVFFCAVNTLYSRWIPHIVNPPHMNVLFGMIGTIKNRHNPSISV